MVLSRNGGSKESQVKHKERWGDEELPIVVQHTYLGVQQNINARSWDEHTNTVLKRCEEQLGKMDVTPRDSYVNSRIKR